METLPIAKAGRPNLIRENAPNRLKEFRMKAGLTQRQVAEAVNVKVSSYANAENYGRSLGKAAWYRLADFFDVDPRILEGVSDARFFCDNNLPKG